MRKLKLLSLITISGVLLAAIAIVATGLAEHVENADMIVVPGNTVFPDGTPSPRLQSRLDVALKLYKEGRAPIIFVSGGTGVEEVDEAVAMSNYLVKKGVPPSAIVKDSFGINTAATARNARNYLKAHHLESAIVATQYFHIARTRLALERNGVRVAGTAYGRYVEIKDVYSILREVVAYPVYYAKL